MESEYFYGYKIWRYKIKDGDYEKFSFEFNSCKELEKGNKV